MHGARNDFVLLDLRKEDAVDLVAFASSVCDRHSGIGADGLLTIGESNRADVLMRIINADGSEALMCGNGIRCMARYLDEAGEGTTLRIETASGIIGTRVIERSPEYTVRVEMGTPRVRALSGGSALDAYVDIGNPHIVLFREEIGAIDLAALAQSYQEDARFSNGVNVHIAHIENSHELSVRHYEHGAGLTMACGTGAVASAAAAQTHDAVTSPVTVCVPGGKLTVEWDRTGSAFLTGPAVRVFDTTFANP